MNDLITAILLGIVEGVTEFLPVSSTGHLILATELFGYNAAQWAMFNVIIQLGAILAILSVYAARLWRMALDLPVTGAHRSSSHRFFWPSCRPRSWACCCIR